ncbi:MAG: substrate-binding domain-containing protein [Anaerolineae bacterium]|nr:substrate-binding domain-containing protein [Anaerolineae bacterium]
MTSTPPLRLHINPQSNLPIFAQLRQQITWLIASGELKPGDSLPSIRELGGQLGIHWHTVRQTYLALEEDGLVETRRKRGTRILPFDLNKLAPQASILPSQTIGVLIPSTDPFYDPLLNGLEETARRASFMLMICFTHDNEALTRQLAQQLLAKNVDGLVAVSPIADVLQRNTAKKEMPPVVYVDAPQFSENTILLDLEGSGYIATTHLLEHGHKRIGYITAPLHWPNFLECFNGYKRALDTVGLELDPRLVIETAAFTLESGYQALSRLLELKKTPKAVFVAGDLLALGVIRALKDSGKRIPEDMAVVSKDNIELAALIEPPLTTVTSPTYQMGVEAMNMLSQLIAGKKLKKKKIILPTELVVRKSCGCRK